MLGFLCILLACFVPCQAQQYRLRYPFTQSTPQCIVGRYNPYKLLSPSEWSKQYAYLYKASNRWSMYRSKAEEINYAYENLKPRIRGEETLERIAYKHLSPYYQGEKTQGAGSDVFYSLYADLDGRVQELMCEANAKDIQRIPIEVFERLEAEVMQSGVGINFNKDNFYLNGGVWIHCFFTCFTDSLRSYGKEREAHYYGEEMPLSINGRVIDMSRAKIIRDIIRTAYRDLWSEGQLRYFTPEIITRLLFDVEGTEYLDTSQHNYHYKEGKKSNVLLPFEQRARVSHTSEMRAYTTDSLVYQVLYTPEAWHEMDDVEFAVETILRLMQVYLSYELMIESYLQPKVKQYLSERHWFYGDFAKTLAYYAELKGLELPKLVDTCINEVRLVLSQLGVNGKTNIEPLLYERFKGLLNP